MNQTPFSPSLRAQAQGMPNIILPAAEEQQLEQERRLHSQHQQPQPHPQPQYPSWSPPSEVQRSQPSQQHSSWGQPPPPSPPPPPHPLHFSHLSLSQAGMGFAATREERVRLIELRCAQLQGRLGLQRDNARNQAEHVLSLWESVLTRHPGQAQAALWDLWVQLLRSQREWNRQVWSRLTGEAVDEEQDPLLQICLYLLLWGELGNLRFCPELGCFLFAAAMAYCRCDQQELGGSLAGSSLSSSHLSAAGKEEGQFLNEVAKPIFATMLTETYEEGQGRQAPKFKYGKAPAPSSASNYDDWNELFWDASRIRACLKLKGKGRFSRRLFATKLAPSQVWKLLPQVDWEASLRGRKSHRELHSVLPLLVGSYRIFLLHSLAFFATLLWASTEPRWGNSLMQAGLGLIAPFWMTIYVVGYQILTPSMSYMSRLLLTVKWLCIYLLPVCSFAVMVLIEDNLVPTLTAASEKVQERWATSTLAIHGVISAVIFILAMLPQGQNAYRWDFYPSLPQNRMWAALAFWLFCCAVAYALSVLVMDASGNAVKGLLLIYGDAFQETILMNALLICQIILLVVPMKLCFFSTLPLLSTVCVALVGAVRGIRNLGGLKLIWYRRGLGMTRAPGKVCKNILQLPHERPADLTMLKAFKWWNHMSDRELNGFVTVWNKTIAELRQRDLVSCSEEERLSFLSVEAVRAGKVPRLLDPLGVFSLGAMLPENREARRRVVTLARSVQMQPLPQGTVRQMPSLSVLVPHYCETILFKNDDLFTGKGTTEMMHFLVKYYRQEFVNFAERMCVSTGVRFHTEDDNAAEPGVALPAMPEVQSRLLEWTSSRMQTLWRTVEGICRSYSLALLTLTEQQESNLSPEQAKQLVKEKFQLVVAVQQYAKFANPCLPTFDAHQLAAVEALLQTFGDWLSIAYIDEEPGDEPAAGRRYFSCLIDSLCPYCDEATERLPTCGLGKSVGMRQPRFRIELPGYPILGHGKSDNQNCAVIFTRGECLQMIDCNQDAYFESALFLPLALQEMVGCQEATNGRRPGILGFREHIFSNIGLLGRLAADSEFTFGTIMQRTMDVPLEARLHYGHPDIMDKLQMLQQGGVSKATKGLNLSEDIFAGLDLVLRGGWITYKEYFHVGKGRDMGFMSALSFYAKVSMGNGEQATTRQWLRLGLELPLPRLLGIFYSHVGFYLNQWVMAAALRIFAFMVAYYTVCDNLAINFADSAVGVTTSYFGVFYLLFVMASMIPLLLEVSIENGLRAALGSVMNSLLSLSPVFAAFQAKLMGHYFEATLYYGGAQYIPTGRGLATARESFVKLFRTFAYSHLHEGFEVAFCLLFTYGVYYGWVFYVCMIFTVASWTFAPFLFNPRQFSSSRLVLQDFAEWIAWLSAHSGDESQSWVSWADTQQLRRRNSSIWWIFMPSWRFWGTVCTAVLVLQMERPADFEPSIEWSRQLLPLLPPLGMLVLCLLTAPLAWCFGESWSPLPSHVILGLLGAAISCVEMGAIEYRETTALAIHLHKYMALTWLLEVCDDIAAHRPGGCCLGIVHSACRRWTRSFRWFRDLMIGSILALLCWLLCLVPCLATLHVLFLFRHHAQTLPTSSNSKGLPAPTPHHKTDSKDDLDIDMQESLEEYESSAASTVEDTAWKMLQRFAPPSCKLRSQV